MMLSSFGTDRSNSMKSSLRTTSAKRLTALALVGGLVLSQTACTTGDGELSADDKVAIATVAGAVVGGIVGYQFLGGEDTRLLWALGLGAAGAYGGKMLGEHLTRYDRTAMQETAYKSLTESPTGETAVWRNGNTGTNGSITPVRTYLDAQGRICREYDAQVNVAGDTVSGREKACLTEAGHWVVSATTG